MPLNPQQSPTIVGIPWLNVKQFGAKGDGVTDDTNAIQLTITVAQLGGGGTVYFPQGTYLVSAALSLSTIPLYIRGDGLTASTVRASASITAIFQFNDPSENLFFHFNDLHLDGNGIAQYGIISNNIAHSSFEWLRIQQTTAAAIALGGSAGSPFSGFCNDVNDCEIANNQGDGVQLTGSGGSTNNITNIFQSKIFANTGIGVNVISGGAGLNIINSTIEANAKCGIYLQVLTRAVRIVGNYFERNGTTGIQFTSPTSKLVKADIVINGSTSATAMSAAFPSSAIEITSNNSLATAAVSTTVSSIMASGDTVANVISTTGFSSSGWLQIDNELMAYNGTTPSSFTGLVRGLLGTTAASHSSSAVVDPYQDAFIYLIGANGVRIENNTLLDTLRPLVGTTFQGSGAAKVTGVNMSSNVLPSGGRLFGGQDATTQYVSTNNVVDWYADSVLKKNYFSAAPSDYGIIVNNSNPVTVSLSATTFNGDVVSEFSAVSGSTNTMGQSISIANYPELAGQLVYFSAWVKVDSAGAEGVALFVTGPGYSNNSFIGDTNWHLLQQVVQMPQTGTVMFGAYKLGAASKAYIARPVVALVGSPYTNLFGTGTLGTTVATTLRTTSIAPLNGTSIAIGGSGNTTTITGGLSVAGNITPDADNTRTFGTTSLRYTSIASLALTAGSSTLTLTGASTGWTFNTVFDLVSAGTMFIGNGVATAVSIGSPNIITYLGGTGPSTGTGAVRVFNPTYLIGSAATSGTTLVNSPFYYMQSNYWTGSATSSLFGGMRMVASSVTPHGYIQFQIGPSGLTEVGRIDDLGIFYSLPGGGFDVMSAGTLNLGTTNATAVVVGKTSITTVLSSLAINLGDSSTSSFVFARSQGNVDTAGGSSLFVGAQGGTASAVVGGAGGSITSRGGTGGTASASFVPGAGGSNSLLGGNAGTGGTGNASGGAAIVDAGTGSGTGVAGAVLIGTTAAASVGIGRTGITTTLNGQVALARTTLAQSTASMTLNFASASQIDVTLSASVTTITINGLATNVPCTVVLNLIQDATGTRTLAGWPATVKWLGSTYRGTTKTAPTFSTAASKRDTIFFYWDGTNLIETDESIGN